MARWMARWMATSPQHNTVTFYRHARVHARHAAHHDMPLSGLCNAPVGVALDAGRQASLREPDASGVPQEQFQAIASGVAKQIEPTGAGRLLKAVLYAGGESVYPQAHVDTGSRIK